MIYEQPANELIRLCLRLETLFNIISARLGSESLLETKLCCETLIEVVNLVDRYDIKKLIHKELMRHMKTLNQLREQEVVDHKKIDNYLRELDELCTIMNDKNHLSLQTLKDNDFLQSIRMYLGNPGGVTAFDHPAYFLWLNQPYAKRLQRFNQWLLPVKDIARAIKLLLHFVRASQYPQNVIAEAGFYYRQLDAKQKVQLIRVHIDEKHLFFPQISTGPHRLSIVFYELNLNERARQTTHAVDFQLSCCVI